MTKEIKDLSYRDAMLRVEEIIREIDRVELDVDALAPLVEEASSLISHCRGLLEATSVRVEGALARLNSDELPKDE